MVWFIGHTRGDGGGHGLYRSASVEVECMGCWLHLFSVCIAKEQRHLRRHWYVYVKVPGSDEWVCFSRHRNCCKVSYDSPDEEETVVTDQDMGFVRFSDGYVYTWTSPAYPTISPYVWHSYHNLVGFSHFQIFFSARFFPALFCKSAIIARTLD